MSTPINDGGPAFHSITVKNGDNYNAPVHTYHRGMSLRDWFAGQAMTAIIGNVYCTPDTTFKEISGRAYAQADAMLAARKEDAR